MCVQSYGPPFEYQLSTWNSKSEANFWMNADYRRSDSKSVYPFKVTLFICFRFNFFRLILNHVLRPMRACELVTIYLSVCCQSVCFSSLFFVFWALFSSLNIETKVDRITADIVEKKSKGSSILENTILECILHEFLMLLIHFAHCYGFIE